MKPHWIYFPFSILYGVAVRLRNLFFGIGIFPSVDIGVPVISVGNLTAGGTGKTPVVIDIVRILKESGMNPAVVSRGYGRLTSGTVVVSDGNGFIAGAADAGDEPVLIAMMTDHAVVISDEDRVRGARTAVNDLAANVIVLDDGFQHRTLRRTKDIVLIDAGELPYTTMLIPAGYRREPLGSIRRAGAVMATKVRNTEEAKAFFNDDRLGFHGRSFTSEFRPAGIRHLFGGVRQSLEILKGHTAVAFCGIAKPEGFRNSLEACGVSLKHFIPFPDHHRFTDDDVSHIIELFRRTSADFLLTTEKDAVRLAGFSERLSKLPVSALTMTLHVHDAEAWKRYLLEGIRQ